MLVPAATAPETTSPSRKKPFYTGLSFQVLVGVGIAIILGYISPSTAIAMKPLGDAFIRLITMIITLVIFCTLVTGIAGMEDMKKVGRVGGKALLYFEVVSTIALLMGLIVGNLVRPGSGFNIDPTTLDAKAVSEYAGQAQAQTVVQFLSHIIPNTIVDAFTRGDILQVLFVSLLFGFALSLAGPRGKPLVDFLDALTRVVFRIVAILMHLDALRSHRGVWRHGVHHRQVRPGFLGPSCKVDCYALLHVLTVRNCPAGGNRSPRRFRNPALPLVSSRRNSSSLGH